MKKLFVLPLFFLFVYTSAQIQKYNKSSLTIEKIMQDPKMWVGTSPSRIFWSEDGNLVYFNWNPGQDTLESLYEYSIRNREIQEVGIEQEKYLPGRRGSYNSDRTLKVYARDGNLFLLNIKKGGEVQLTDWLQQASLPEFALNGTHISFLLNQNLFLLNLEIRKITQVTNFAFEQKHPEKKGNEQAKWLINQQKELFDVLNEREAVNKARERRRDVMTEGEPEKIILGKKRLRNASLSPSGKFVVYTTFLSPENSESTSVTRFVTESGYTEESRARTKVGSPESKMEMGIFDVENNASVELIISDIPGLKDMPDYLKDYPGRIPEDNSKIKDRDVNLLGPVWNKEKDLALVVALSHDNKDRWILILDPATGHLDVVDRQRDEAWIGGPGIGGWGASTGNIGWMPDGKSVWFQSEESGYSHLYSVNTETKEIKALTNGEFEISNAFISHDKKYFYLTANKVHPGITHFYKMPVWGGGMVQITSVEGGNDVTLSPDEKYLAVLHSKANKPWELYLQQNRAGAKMVQVTKSTIEEFDEYNWRTPEFITFNAEDGAKVHARLYRPENPEKQGSAIIFVHGAGYLQNAHKWWSSYFREYMFHNYLADNGYTVLDLDYRGSAGYGRDWRTGIYRHMGGKDLSDQVDGAKMLVEKYDVSPGKIGIYGGSYGGFITLMAMFKYPDVFAAGAGLRSVTDWAHYNHGYTSNILNTPVEDSLAYVRSSPIYFAEGLQGALLMCHGMVDDNVQFQDIVRLTQRLIELGKENWELAVYPVESHGFRASSSWIDEYKRIFKLFEENLK